MKRQLSIVLLLLMMVSSITGLLYRDLYQDPQPVQEMLRGYDLVTLVVVAPLLAFATWRRTPRAELIWLGILTYAVYNYAIYVFGSAFNKLFLVHVAAFSLSITLLILGLVRTDAQRIKAAYHSRTPIHLVSAVLMLLAAALAGMWIFYSARFAFTGAAPQESELVLPIAGVHLGYVLDLALLAPATAIAAALLWRRAVWGYVLAPMMAIGSGIYQLNYVAALAFQAAADIPGSTAFDPAEPFIALLYLMAIVPMLLGIRAQEGDMLGSRPPGVYVRRLASKHDHPIEQA